jgi:Resolvase, N terminal domain
MRKPDRPKSGVIFRCAIYTRKSSDDGLEQEFNSLDAQREACEAYVTSQRHAGLIALPEMYDDGGLSGGTIERPALQRLLSDIKAGKVQIIVVYKVDREAFSNATLFSSLRVPDPVFLIVTVSAGAFNSLFRRVDRQPRLVFLFGKRNCAERHGDVFLTQTHESAHVQHHGVDRTIRREQHVRDRANSLLCGVIHRLLVPR